MKDVDDTPDALERRLRKLSAELPPARDLWPDIAARIEAEEDAQRRAATARGRWRIFALAASVALVAVIGASIFDRDAPRETRGAPVFATAPAISTFGPGHDLGAEYRTARAGLAHDLERRLEALSPEARETVMENLEVIRRAAAEIDAALAQDPANGLLQHQLLAAYQDELSVLANMQRVTARLPSRNEI